MAEPTGTPTYALKLPTPGGLYESVDFGGNVEADQGSSVYSDQTIPALVVSGDPSRSPLSSSLLRPVLPSTPDMPWSRAEGVTVALSLDLDFPGMWEEPESGEAYALVRGDARLGIRPGGTFVAGDEIGIEVRRSWGEGSEGKWQVVANAPDTWASPLLDDPVTSAWVSYEIDGSWEVGWNGVTQHAGSATPANAMTHAAPWAVIMQVASPPSLAEGLEQTAELYALDWWMTPPAPMGMWNARQRQTATGNAGGLPLRQRQNGGTTGAWPLRQRQTGI